MRELDGSWVYIHWGEDRVLYVGRTTRPTHRTETHSTKSRWWGEVKYVAWYRYENTDLAAEAESTAVKDYQPPFNKTLLVGPYPPLAHKVRRWVPHMGVQFLTGRKSVRRSLHYAS